MKSPNSNATQLYGFARFNALASTKITDKKQEYAVRAMEFLQQAVKAGFKDAAQISNDSDLDPLRDREDFKKLLAELQSSQTKLVEPASAPTQDNSPVKP